MTKSSDAIEANQSVSTQTDKRLVSKISNSSKQQQPQNRWVSREHFIRLLLAHHRLERCDDLQTGRRGLKDPTTGDCFYIGEDDLLTPRTA